MRGAEADGMVGKTKAPTEIEVFPDAWERFERAVDAVSKSGPQHRITKPTDAASSPIRPTRRGAATAHSNAGLYGEGERRLPDCRLVRPGLVEYLPTMCQVPNQPERHLSQTRGTPLLTVGCVWREFVDEDLEMIGQG